jgi:hypothetical protein
MMRFSLFRGLMVIAGCALLFAAPVRADIDDPATTREIAALLSDFLSHNDQRAQHDRFWGEDLIYTSSKGKVSGKAEIMDSYDTRHPAADKPKQGAPYAAEDVKIRAYGDAAALTFRLVANNADGSHSYYRNSGMFLRRDGQWRAVTWQATPATAKD